jgi:hypothetical protein
MRKYMIGASGIAVLAAIASPASSANLSYFTAALNPLSGSGVSGTANATLDTNDNSLLVQIMASGLEPNQPHPQHIHGAFDMGVTGNPIDSTAPTLAQDTDGDGFIELAEGLPTYGPVLVPLTSPPDAGLAGFPTAPDGTIDFSQLYDLGDPVTFASIPDGDDDPGNDVKYTKADLLPLVLREVVLHGMTVPDGVGAGTDGEVNGVGGYKAVLPVAAGEFLVADANFNVIPLPAAGWMLLTALGGLGLLGRHGGARTREA